MDDDLGPEVDAATSRLLAVSRDSRIDVYDMQNPNRPIPVSTLSVNGAMKISRATLATSKNSFYLHKPNGRGRIIDFSEGNGIVMPIIRRILGLSALYA